MSNSTNARYSRPATRLLATASTMVLIASIYGSEQAIASGADPFIWIELGWQTESVGDSSDGFALPVSAPIEQSGLTSSLIEKLNLSRSIGDEGKITFQPDGSDWIFSAAIRYGRSHGVGRTNQALAPITKTSFQTYHTYIPTYPFPYHKTNVKQVQFTQTKFSSESINSETHTIIDFEAGQDVGLGLFGHGGKSTVSAGVRFAHLSVVHSAANLAETANNQFSYTKTSHTTNAFFPSGVRVVPWYFIYGRETWDVINGSGRASHEFRGIGPSVNWDASASIWSAPQGSAVSIDWGVNAALLFGKQKDEVQAHMTVKSHCVGQNCPPLQSSLTTSKVETGKNITMPNAGGFIGVSYRLLDFKASAGYRADYFFRAIDTGVSGQHAVTRSFQGPYASISIGIGD